MPTVTRSKRSRPAATTSPAKKQKVDVKGKAKGTSSAAAAVRAGEEAEGEVEQKVTAKRPITRGKALSAVYDDDDTSEEEGDSEVGMDGDGDGEGLESDDGGEEEKDEDEEMQDEEQPKRDPKAKREAREAAKAARQERRAAKPHASLIAEAKRVWSSLRQKDISAKERKVHLAEMMEIIGGRVQEVVFKHDASRIIQSVVKWGGKPEREQVASELNGKYIELVQGKYSKFLVASILRHTPSAVPMILSEFQGHIIRLLLHAHASPIVADTYAIFANADGRQMMVQDFWGPEFRLFDKEAGVAGKKGDGKGEGRRRLLGDVLDEMPEPRRKTVLENVRESLRKLWDNESKNAISYAIVHKVMMDYATYGSGDDAEKRQRDMFETIIDQLPEIVHTRDGSQLARMFLAEGNAKDRKQIIKVLKPHLDALCRDEQAQLVLFTALDVVDDTKLMAKSVIQELAPLFPSLCADKNGRKVLLYLLCPRSSRYFTPATTRLLAETDSIRSRTSKKDPKVRQGEVLEAASPGLLRMVAGEGGTMRQEGEEVVLPSGIELFRDTASSLIVLETMLYARGDKAQAMSALLEPVGAPYLDDSQREAGQEHIMDLSHTQRIYKTLIQGGHFDIKTKTVHVIDAAFSLSFAKAFLAAAGKENIGAFAKGGGAFVVVELIERLRKAGGEGKKELEEIKGLFGGKKTRAEIEKAKPKGGELLLNKLAEL